MFQTIRARLTAISVVITTSSLIALAIIAYAVVRDYTLRSIDSHIGQLTHEHASKVSVWIQEKQRIASALKLAVAQAEHGDPDLLLQSVKQSGAFDDVFFTRSADKRHFAIPPITDASFDGTSRPWYKQAAAAGGPVVTPAYVDAGTGKLNVTLAEPVGPAGQPQAVIGVAFLLESMSREIAAIRPLDKSFAVLLDTDGSILAYRQPELALKPPTAIAPGLDAALLQRLAADGGHAQVAVDGAEQFVYAANVAGTPWTLAICVDRAEATAALAALSRTMLIAVTVCLLAAAAIIGATVHRLLRRLAVVRDALENISSSEGDLTHRLDAHGSDELSQITGAFNRFTDKIAAVLARVRSNAESVRTATVEIAAGNLDLSARTEVQASALEQTAASIEELTSAVHQNAESAQQAKRLATNAAEIAAQGNRAITSVVATMGEINEASHKIADIIGMIDGIAFQTNILALNAAVEAARAGEQGRGFAVVASEVRALAGRSAQAAKDIKTLIENSVAKAEQGAAQVADAGSKVASLLASSQRVADILAEISAASMEQSQGIEQVNQAIGQMDDVTQQNAALVEESTAATQSLESQVRQLAEVIATFRIDHAVVTKQDALDSLRR